jgi:hypothetical protein
VHAAVRALPLPETAMAEQPPIEPAPSLKFTLPVGLVPDTVAVKVTLVPAAEGFCELASVVVVGGRPGALTTCERVLLDGTLPESPP